MTVAAIILILLSTCFHAGWNLLTKSGKPSPLFFFILTVSTVLLVSPFFLCNLRGIQAIPQKFWLLLLLTGIFETMYYTGLSQAYRHGDISLVYPLVRALPVLLVPFVCFLLGIGKDLSFAALAGMGLIGVGCLMMPVKSFRTWHFRDYWGRALFWVIPGALGTVGYTIVDSEAIKLLDVKAFSVPVNIVYSFFINVMILPYLGFVITVSGGWKELKDYKGRRIFRPILASVGCSLSYMLILASMKYVTNVSYVAGFRQFSIPLGVILGVVILKERFFLPRIIGCVIIAAGLILTAVY
jgi:uncharacterized membrane protein